MKKLNVIQFMLAILVLVFSACTKKDDDSIYQPKGNYQPAGNYGNAEITSHQYTVSWTISAPDYYCDILTSDITQAIVDNGSVEVYMSNGSGGWIALPCTLPMSASYASTYTPVHYLGGVTVWKTDTDLTQTSDPGLKTFKVICISQKAMKMNPTVNWKDYNEVKQVFNLRD